MKLRFLSKQFSFCYLYNAHLSADAACQFNLWEADKGGWDSCSPDHQHKSSSQTFKKLPLRPLWHFSKGMPICWGWTTGISDVENAMKCSFQQPASAAEPISGHEATHTMCHEADVKANMKVWGCKLPFLGMSTAGTVEITSCFSSRTRLCVAQKAGTSQKDADTG